MGIILIMVSCTTTGDGITAENGIVLSGIYENPGDLKIVKWLRVTGSLNGRVLIRITMVLARLLQLILVIRFKRLGAGVAVLMNMAERL